nr:PREDICTED: heparan-sulfate 6-O-sulfotransferase 1 [Opisthocomus hoazin]
MSELQVFACVSSQEDMRIWRYIYSFDVNELSKEKSKLVDMEKVFLESQCEGEQEHSQEREEAKTEDYSAAAFSKAHRCTESRRNIDGLKARQRAVRETGCSVTSNGSAGPYAVFQHQVDGPARPPSVGLAAVSSVTGLPSRQRGTLLRPGAVIVAPPRKFYYITLLRDPVSRYLSEWRHVQRGATWKTSLHMCDGRTPTPEELPSCYEGTDWSGCTLQEFMDCPYNLANNRQVRMLADLSLVGCYNMSFIPENKRAQILLESAKKNLKDMAFFGLTEFQRKTQYLFERTFNLKFIRPFMQYNSTRAGGVEVDNDTIRRIEELNDLDMQLYDYAKDLFQQRYQYKRQLERMEQRIKNREERLLHRSNEALPKEETEEQGRLPTEDYMSHIIEKW